jgi:hypothetical protein
MVLENLLFLKIIAGDIDPTSGRVILGTRKTYVGFKPKSQYV